MRVVVTRIAFLKRRTRMGQIDKGVSRVRTSCSCECDSTHACARARPRTSIATPSSREGRVLSRFFRVSLLSSRHVGATFARSHGGERPGPDRRGAVGAPRSGARRRLLPRAGASGRRNELRVRCHRGRPRPLDCRTSPCRTSRASRSAYDQATLTMESIAGWEVWSRRRRAGEPRVPKA
jgi:hypothetical protein